HRLSRLCGLVGADRQRLIDDGKHRLGPERPSRWHVLSVPPRHMLSVPPRRPRCMTRRILGPPIVPSGDGGVGGRGLPFLWHPRSSRRKVGPPLPLTLN